MVELESQKIQNQIKGEEGSDEKSTASVVYKQEKAKRNEQRNFIRKTRKDIQNLENAMEKLKAKASEIQTEIDNTPSDAGWSVLAELTDKLNAVTADIDAKEVRWLELAEELEEAEASMVDEIS